MENLEILIIEDNISFALELEMALNDWGCKSVNIADNSEDALRILGSSMADIILMDIDIQGELNGIQIAEKIQNTGIPIIYITGQNLEEYYEKAKETNLSSYLIKPFDNITLKSAIETSMTPKSLEEEDEGFKFFYVRKGKSLKKVLIENIDMIVSDGNYCYLHHNDLKSVVKTSLKKLLSQLPPQHFIRVHNRYVIRIDKISEVFLSKGKLIINDQLIPIGRNYKKQLKEVLNIL